MVRGDDIEERLMDFVVAVIYLCEKLPKSQAMVHIAWQLLRSGTAPAAHIAEAHYAESVKDFIHKLRLCLKEWKESMVWLKNLDRLENLLKPEFHGLFSECDELCLISNASIQTTRKRLD